MRAAGGATDPSGPCTGCCPSDQPQQCRRAVDKPVAAYPRCSHRCPTMHQPASHPPALGALAREPAGRSSHSTSAAGLCSWCWSRGAARCAQTTCRGGGHGAGQCQGGTGECLITSLCTITDGRFVLRPPQHPETWPSMHAPDSALAPLQQASALTRQMARSG